MLKTLAGMCRYLYSMRVWLPEICQVVNGLYRLRIVNEDDGDVLLLIISTTKASLREAIASNSLVSVFPTGGL